MKTQVLMLGVGICCVLLLGAAPSAKACGLKLAVKDTKSIVRSAHPTTVHVFADTQQGEVLRKSLERAGHKVVIASDMRTLRGTNRGQMIVIADQAKVKQLQQAMPGVTVLPTTVSARGSVQALELELSKRAQLSEVALHANKT